ncbi:MAG TPA: uracil-DNA glycosylase [Dissulfurispiraceae bacterium]
MPLAEDIKTVLEFYDALGFEKLPLPPMRKKGRPAATKLPGPAIPKFAAPEIKEAALGAVREEIGDCKRCKLSKGRTAIVFGEGNPDAELMFIGEGPGREEDLQGRPFVGDAGKLLDRLIEKMGFRREEVYIGNIVKCRPPMNRDPEEDEVASCIPFIQKQIGVIAPKVIVSLGRISAHTLTGTSIPISKLRGTFYEYRGIPLMPTFHPAYLLRNPNAKWDVWRDMQKVLEKLKGEKR